MGFFQTIWSQQTDKLLAPEIRSVSVRNFMASLMNGLQVPMDGNAAWEADLRLRSKFNSQKMVLQAALNTIFATTGIIVTTNTGTVVNNFSFNESEGIDPIFTYNEGEGTTTYIYNESEAVDDFDFTIKIPTAFYTSEIDRRVRTEVTKLKLSGKLFNIITY